MAEADRRAAQHKSDVIYDENVELLHEIENSELVQESYRLRESCDSYIGRLHWYNPNKWQAAWEATEMFRQRRLAEEAAEEGEEDGEEGEEGDGKELTAERA